MDKAYHQNWRDRNREAARASSKAHYARNKDKLKPKRRAQWIKKNYGMTEKEWNDLFESQDRKCGVCKTSKTDRPWVTDHNHETGRVRGILCSNCNRGIGLLKDSTTVLQLAIEYLDWTNQ